MVRLLFLVLGLALVLTTSPRLADAKDTPSPPETTLPDFFGTYEGRTLFPMGEASNRDMVVTIGPFEEGGLAIEWETTSTSTSAQEAGRATSLQFRPAPRTGLLVAVGPFDDLPNLAEGETFAWARLSGATLTVNLFTIVDGGDYVVQTYDRTLVRNRNLLLEYRRFRNGVVERQIKGNLARISDVVPDGPL